MQENALWLDYLENSYNERRRSQSREVIKEEDESTNTINEAKIGVNLNPTNRTKMPAQNNLRQAAGQASRLTVIPEVTRNPG